MSYAFYLLYPVQDVVNGLMVTGHVVSYARGRACEATRPYIVARLYRSG